MTFQTHYLNSKKNTLWFHIGKCIFNKSIYDDIIVNWEKDNDEKKNIFDKYILKYRF